MLILDLVLNARDVFDHQVMSHTYCDVEAWRQVTPIIEVMCMIKPTAETCAAKIVCRYQYGIL